MQVPKILNNRYVKQFGLFATLSVPIVATTYSCENMIVNKIQNEIASKDSARYKRVLTEAEGKGIVIQKQIWSKELKDMNDSIKIEAIATRAYHEGAQMVRDSLKNTSKQ